MRVEVETTKKEAIGVASFLKIILFQLFRKNWRSYEYNDSPQIINKAAGSTSIVNNSYR